MGFIIVHFWYWNFIMSLYPFLGCHLHVYLIHSYLVNIMHKLLFSFSADELGAIFISNKLHPKAINNFLWIFPYRYYAGVSMLLGLFIAYLLCVFTSIYWCILVICVNLVFSPCLVVPCLHCFFLWRHPWHWRATGNLILGFLWHKHSVYYSHLMSSHIVPYQCIIIIQFIIILPHIL